MNFLKYFFYLEIFLISFVSNGQGNRLMGIGAGHSISQYLFTLQKDGSSFVKTRFTSNASRSVCNPILVNNKYWSISQGGKYGYGTIYSYDKYLDNAEILVQFNDSLGKVLDVVHPRLLKINNYIYGFTNSGGQLGHGTIFCIDTITKDMQILHNFSNPYLSSGDVEFYNDKIWGLSNIGGQNSKGYLFSFDINSNLFTIEVNLDQNSMGENPKSSVLRIDSLLWCTFSQGGNFNQGTISTYNLNSGNHSIVHHLSGNEGEAPSSGLIQSNQFLIGTCISGGNNNHGTIFRFNPSNSTYNVLYHFDTTHYNFPRGNISIINGKIIGVSLGFQQDSSRIYILDTTGSNFQNIYKFDNLSLTGTSVFGNDVLVCDLVRNILTVNQNFEVDTLLHLYDTFGVGYNDFGLIQYYDKFYFINQSGGPFGYGCVNRVDSNGINLESIRCFGGYKNDKVLPYFGIKDDIIYGITAYTYNDEKGYIFKMNIDGSQFRILKILNDSTGHTIESKPIFHNSKLYWVANRGGNNQMGTIMSLDTNGSNFEVVYNITDRKSVIKGVSKIGNNIAINLDQSITFLFNLNNGTGTEIMTGANHLSKNYFKIGNEIIGFDLGGGINGSGSVYRMNIDGSNYQEIHNFNSAGLSSISDWETFYDNQIWSVGTINNYTSSAIFYYDVTNMNSGVIYELEEEMTQISPLAVINGVTTSLKSINNLEILNPYPNPFTNKIILQGNIDFSSLSLYNSLGLKVGIPSHTMIDDKLLLCTEKLSNGIYFLEYYCEGKKQVNRVIKK